MCGQDFGPRLGAGLEGQDEWVIAGWLADGWMFGWRDGEIVEGWMVDDGCGVGDGRQADGCEQSVKSVAEGLTQSFHQQPCPSGGVVEHKGSPP